MFRHSSRWAPSTHILIAELRGRPPPYVGGSGIPAAGPRLRILMAEQWGVLLIMEVWAFRREAPSTHINGRAKEGGGGGRGSNVRMYDRAFRSLASSANSRATGPFYAGRLGLPAALSRPLILMAEQRSILRKEVRAFSRQSLLMAEIRGVLRR